MDLPAHGANPHQLYAALHIEKPESIIDFSENTNPYGIPLSIKKEWPRALSCVSKYPEPYSETLKEKISRLHNLSSSHILIGNGASQCIYLLSRLFKDKRVLIIEPTFNEYKRALTINGAQTESYVLKERDHFHLPFAEIKQKMSDFDGIFICHPNNPTGSVYEKEPFFSFINAMEQQKKWVMIDEAFFHFWKDGYSVDSLVKTCSYVIVLRSLTKMFHLAGLRLGYMLADPHVVSELMHYQEPWAVNHVIQHLAGICIKDGAFIEQTVKQIDFERTHLYKRLNELNYTIYPSVVNFYLLENEKKEEELFLYLLKQGLIPRHTYNFNGLDGRYLRLAIRTKDENKRLLEALESWRKQ